MFNAAIALTGWVLVPDDVLFLDAWVSADPQEVLVGGPEYRGGVEHLSCVAIAVLEFGSIRDMDNQWHLLSLWFLVHPDGEVADVVDPDVADGFFHRGEAHAPFVGPLDDRHSLEDGWTAFVRWIDVVAFAFALVERGARGGPRPLEDRLPLLWRRLDAVLVDEAGELRVVSGGGDVALRGEPLGLP